MWARHHVGLPTGSRRSAQSPPPPPPHRCIQPRAPAGVWHSFLQMPSWSTAVRTRRCTVTSGCSRRRVYPASVRSPHRLHGATGFLGDLLPEVFAPWHDYLSLRVRFLNDSWPEVSGHSAPLRYLRRVGCRRVLRSPRAAVASSCRPAMRRDPCSLGSPELVRGCSHLLHFHSAFSRYFDGEVPRDHG